MNTECPKNLLSEAMMMMADMYMCVYGQQTMQLVDGKPVQFCVLQNRHTASFLLLRRESQSFLVWSKTRFSEAKDFFSTIQNTAFKVNSEEARNSCLKFSGFFYPIKEGTSELLTLNIIQKKGLLHTTCCVKEEKYYRKHYYLLIYCTDGGLTKNGLFLLVFSDFILTNVILWTSNYCDLLL